MLRSRTLGRDNVDVGVTMIAFAATAVIRRVHEGGITL